LADSQKSGKSYKKKVSTSPETWSKLKLKRLSQVEN
jgi:hypothetical protein